MAKNNEYVKKRKSYYGFAKNYPGKLGSSKYVIGESRIVRRNETIRKIVIAIIIILLFIASYVITTVGFKISDKKPNNKTTAVRLIPVYGKGVGESVEFGGLLGHAPIMKLSEYSSEEFIARGGRIPAPIHSLRN